MTPPPRSVSVDRRDLLGLGGLALLAALAPAPRPARAQSGAGKAARVGLLGVTSETGYARQIRALREGFRDLGYVEGRNLVIEYRWAQGEYGRLPALAAELVRLRPDVIVTSGPGVRVMKEATTTIPIVMAVGGDVVASGFVASLAHPGGNLTGSTFFGPELSAKRLELLKEALPHLGRVAVLLNPGSDYQLDLERVSKAAAALNVEIFETPARSPREFGDALALAVRRRAGGLVCLSDSMLVANMRPLGELSVAKGLPAAGSDEFAEGGGLLAYGVSFPELWRRAPYFVDKILKGVKPATIPVERASKFELIVNLRTARAIAVTIPQSFLIRADHVID